MIGSRIGLPSKLGFFDNRYVNVSGDTMTGALTVSTINGSATASGTLTLVSTSNATKGKILFGTSAYDEVNNRLGIGLNNPASSIEIASGYYIAPNASGYIIRDSGGTVRWGIYGDSGNTLYLGDTVGFTEVRIRPGTTSYVIVYTSSGNLGLNQGTFGTNAANVLAILNGTAPTTSPADTIQLFSKDISTGNTTLGIYAEGTGIVATGQADSVSSVRVVLNINGVDRTFLCI